MSIAGYGAAPAAAGFAARPVAGKTGKLGVVALTQAGWTGVHTTVAVRISIKNFPAERWRRDFLAWRYRW